MIHVKFVNNQQEVTPVSYVTMSFAKSEGRVDQEDPKRYIYVH